MLTRQLGYTDLFLSTIGFGTWAIGGGGWEWSWGPQDDRDSIAAIQAALDLGVNWIDTAAGYGLGHAEEVVGKAIKGRQGVIVATKGGQVPDPNHPGKTHFDLSAKGVRAACEASLRRLGIERIDLYQIHWPIPEGQIEEGWTEIARLIQEGKVRYAGVSNFSVEQIKRIQPIHEVASDQPEYSLLEPGPEKELLIFCFENRIGVVAYSPMASGLLTGKYTRQRVAALPDDDWRKTRDPNFQPPLFDRNLELVEKLREIAARTGHTPGQLAVAWVLRRPEVTSAIVGGRSPQQVKEIIPAGDWVLSQQEIGEIDELVRASLP